MVVPGMVRSCAAWDGVRRASVFNCCINPRRPLLVMLYTVAWALVFGRYREPRPPSGVGGPRNSRPGARWEGRAAPRDLERLS